MIWHQLTQELLLVKTVAPGQGGDTLMTSGDFLLHSWRERERGREKRGGEATKRELALRTPLRTVRTQRGGLRCQ